MPEFDDHDIPSFNVDGYDFDFSDEEQYQEQEAAQQTHHHPSQENMSNPMVPRTRAMPRHMTNIFTKHFKKMTLPSGDLQAKCKYCSKSYKFQQGDGYYFNAAHREESSGGNWYSNSNFGILVSNGISWSNILLSTSPPASRHVVDAAFDHQHRGKQLAALHALGNIAGETRVGSNIVLNNTAEENLKRLIYEKASNTAKLTPSVS